MLYLVGTPIGHLGDLSPRAQSLLKEVSFIACEDTRHSGHLLKSLGAKGRRISFHKHNTNSKLPQLLEILKQGQNTLALISDAGLPGISDPGEILVSKAKEAGHEVICIPGPCAATTALVSSGLPCERFCFEGFLPTKGKLRKERLSELAIDMRTVVLYESPHRLIQLLTELEQLCGKDRPLQVARELTKRHEEQVGPNIGAAIKHFLTNKPLGEFTLVLGGKPKINSTCLKPDEEWIQELNSLMSEGMSASEAARQLAQQTGQSRRFLYGLLHKGARNQND